MVRNDLSITLKLGALAVMVFLGLMLLGGFALWQMQLVNQTVKENLQKIDQLNQSVSQIEQAHIHFKTQVQEWKNILIRGNDPEQFDLYLGRFNHQAAQVKALLQQSMIGFTGLAIDSTELARLQQLHSELIIAYLQALTLFNPDDPQTGKHVDITVRGIDRAASEGLEQYVADIQHYRLATLEEINAITQQRFFRTSLLLLIVTASITIICVPLFWLITRHDISKPLGRVTQQLTRMVDGDFSVQASQDDIHRGDDIGVLSRAAVSLTDIRYHETQLRNILSSVADAILTIDSEQIIISANPATEHIFGYSTQELIGADVGLIMPQWLGEEQNNLVRHTLNEQAIKIIIGMNREVHGRRRDGSLFPAELTITEFYMQDQRFLTGIIRDISERKNYETALILAREDAEEANQAKSAFLATMSHEIRTPMNGVIGLIDVLTRSPLNAEQQLMLVTIKDSAFSLLSIIDEILDFSKIEAKKLTLEYTTISLPQIIKGVTNTLHPLAAGKHLELYCDCDPELPEWVCSDPVRLRQILFNLVGNAVKFTPSEPPHSGWVRLRVSCISVTNQHCRVHFQISDNGIGIDPEKLSELFQPFTQAENSTTRRFGGTGLGLSICARLVEMMGGMIKVTSQLGQGSTFEFELEFERTSQPPVAQIAPESSLYPLTTPFSSIQAVNSTGQPILVAEDNPTNRMVIRYQLTMLGYRADIVDDGLQALEHLRTGRYVLLLTDYHMPHLDGLALIAAVREMERDHAQRLPIIMFTATAAKSEAQRFLDSGADDVLTKPVILEDLQRVLTQWVPVSRDLPEIENPTPAMSTGHAPAAAAVDIDVLKSIIGDNPVVMQAVLQQFLHSTTATLEHWHTDALAPSTINQQAHKLKAAARSVGALRLGELCQALEDAGEANDVAALPRLLAELNVEWLAVEGFIIRYCE